MNQFYLIPKPKIFPILFSVIVYILGLLPSPLLKGQSIGRSMPVAKGAFLDNVFPTQPPTPSQGDVSYTVENAFPNLDFTDPVKMLEMPDNRWMLIGKSGHVWIFENRSGVSSKIQVLNLKDQVVIGGDGGMLGGALHPDFGKLSSPNRGYFYLWYRYTPQKGSHGDFGYLRLSRFTYDEESNQVDKNSEFVLIQQFDRHDWHNGGDMFFGPSGFLYVAVGDEGGARDQFNVTQQIDKWLFGGVLRIDVDKRGGSISHPIRRQPQNQANPPSGWPNSFTQGYYIPNDNPWNDTNGETLEEFYAIGLRSPHRMTYDEATGDIWIGDIGQNRQEEISLVAKGDNLQWPYREGNLEGFRDKPNELIGIDKPPIYTYARQTGASVIGGYLYRGNKFPELQGKFIYGDHETQNISLLTPNANKTGGSSTFLLNIPTEGVSPKDGISSFALDEEGNVYVLDLFGTDLDGGKIRKIVRRGGGVADPPERLSQLNVFTSLDPLTPAPFLLPYQVNAPFWSDGAQKKRWIILPNDGVHDSEEEQIQFRSSGSWGFPAGTIWIKHFDLPIDRRDPSQSRKLETRFLVTTVDGQAYGLTYKWNEEGTEAFLLKEGENESYPILQPDGTQEFQEWIYPEREQCLSCHNEKAGYVLGVRTRQLNGSMLYPTTGIDAHQLDTWEGLGMFGSPLPEKAHLAHNVQLNQAGTSVEFQIRSYLDANCGYCHQPGNVSGAFDAQGSTPLYEQNLINGTVVSNSSPPGAKLIVPGNLGNSHFWARSTLLGNNGMPPIGRNVLDETYVDQLEQWINDLEPKFPSNLQEGWYTLELPSGESVLGVEGASGAEAASLHLAGPSDQASHLWYIKNQGNNKYSLHARHSYKSMAYEQMESEEGREIVQEVFRASQDQLWYFFLTDEDQYVLRNVFNGLYLGEEANSSVTLWNRSPGTAPKWVLRPYSDQRLEQCRGPESSFLSDLDWEGEPKNGWGPVERDQSNGETEIDDGATLQINGVAYEKGLGVHAESEIIFPIEASYDLFISDIGVDDESCETASVQFEVFVDDFLAYTSPLMRRSEEAISIEIPVEGAEELRLVVNNGHPALGEDSKSCDHANWADARLVSCVQEGPVSRSEEILPSVNVFPNPAAEKVHITWEPSLIPGTVRIELFALDGRRVLKENSPQPTELPVGNLARGTYILQLTQGNRMYRSKLWLK